MAHLTPMESRFAAVMAATGDPTYAAAKAGYAHPQPRGNANVRKPHVMAEVMRVAQHRVGNELLPLAVDKLKWLLESKQTAGNTLLGAIKLTFDTAGVGRPDAGATKDPSEMTGEELAQAIATLERAAAQRAIDITPEPIDEAPPASVFE